MARTDRDGWGLHLKTATTGASNETPQIKVYSVARNSYSKAAILIVITMTVVS